MPTETHFRLRQRVQNSLAKVVVYTTAFSYRLLFTLSSVLEKLHWLPVEWQLRFIIATLIHTVIDTGSPPYLADLL